MKQVQKCKTQEEILKEFLFEIDFDKYKMLLLKFENSNNDHFTEIDKLVNSTEMDCIYIKWHAIKDILSSINDTILISNFKEELRFYKEEISYKNENRRVVYNCELFLQFDVYHIEKYGISIYDRIKSYFDRMLNLIDFISNELDKRINEIGTGNTSSKYKPLELKFGKNQTDTIAFFLIGQNYGVFHDPEKQRPLSKIFDGAKFYENGIWSTPGIGSVKSIISRNKKGKDKNATRVLDRKTKKKLIIAAQNFISDLESNSIQIYEK